MAKKQKSRQGRFSSPRLRNASNTLLANIRFASVDDKVKVVAVTSAGVDEGKTTVCTNLATAMASSGKKVLLMECDMRRRSLASVAEVHPKHGLYAVLAGEASVVEAVVATEVPGVFLLDAESDILNPPDLLSAKRFAALVQALRAMYDFVVLDTPPLGVFVDAALVGSVADGVLFAVREREAKRTQVAACLTQLEQANARILGLVTTFTRGEAKDGYYYAYYYEDGRRDEDDASAEVGREAVEPLEGDFDDWARRVGIGDLVERKTPRHSRKGGKGSRS